jgi:hypothetical protein
MVQAEVKTATLQTLVWRYFKIKILVKTDEKQWPQNGRASMTSWLRNVSS